RAGGQAGGARGAVHVEGRGGRGGADAHLAAAADAQALAAAVADELVGTQAQVLHGGVVAQVVAAGGQHRRLGGEVAGRVEA
nr:hypothetical protein [Tanacetum cinerariifolium]